MYWFENLNPVIQALIATTFTWAVTALGALVVCFFKNMNKKVLNTILGFSAGVMIAASFWSLISPAIDLSIELGYIAWLLPTIGFAVGGLFVLLSDRFLDKVLKNKKNIRCADSLKRSILLVSAITIHNIPEGMAVGVAFGALASGQTVEAVAAVMLAVGIGIQNFPEGMCVAFPLRANGLSRGKSFLIGQLSGAVEIVAGVIGAIAVTLVNGILPWALSFSAGAMMAVVCSELIPESFANGKIKATVGVIFGFSLMMILDVAFG